MTNELTGWVGTIGAAVEQMQHWPSAVLIIAVLIVYGGLMKSIDIFPNKFIPACVLVVGSALNVMMGDYGSVSTTQRHPELVLALQGFMLGFAAWALHNFLLRRFEKFIPFLEGKGDSETKDTTKP
jgi:hypothetical protein